MSTDDPKNSTAAAIVSPSSTISKLEFKALLKTHGFPKRMIEQLSANWKWEDDSEEQKDATAVLESIRDLINKMKL